MPRRKNYIPTKKIIEYTFLDPRNPGLLINELSEVTSLLQRRLSSLPPRQRQQGVISGGDIEPWRKNEKAKGAHGSTTPELRRNEKPYFYIRRNELLYAPD